MKHSILLASLIAVSALAADKHVWHDLHAVFADFLSHFESGEVLLAHSLYSQSIRFSVCLTNSENFFRFCLTSKSDSCGFSFCSK